MAVRLSLLLLAASCVLIGLCAPWVVEALAPALTNATGLPADSVNTSLMAVRGAFSATVLASLVLLVLLALLALLRQRLLARRSVEEHVTWDCGYARPTSRMQYTASSFAQPLTSLFRFLLRTRFAYAVIPGLFPRAASLATETEDLARARLYQPLFVSIGRSLSSLRWVQHGQVHLYVLYIALTLLVLLVWKLG